MLARVFTIFLIIATLSRPSIYGDDDTLFYQIKSLFEQYGNKKYMICEEVTQCSHVLQAALIAKMAGAPEDVVIGLLVHDIGQIACEDHVGDVDYLHAKHDEMGAEWLERHGFPSFVCDLVRFHTIVKVVLCMEEPAYFENLSDASKASYFIQRDKYLNEEGLVTLTALLNHPRFTDLKLARKCDEMAKIIGLSERAGEGEILLPSFESYFEMGRRVLNGTGSKGGENWREQIQSSYQRMVDNRADFESAFKQKVSAISL